MNEYQKGYEQAIKDINTPLKVIIKDWEPSECPRCHEHFDEVCDDGYYTRDVSMERCPNCGQRLKWL